MIARTLSIMALCLTAVTAQAETLRLAVTTSFHNSGLAEVLLPRIAEDIGIDVQLLVVGTGQALKLGRAGDVDAVLVHSKAAEQAFVAEGYGPRRTEIMYNDFVLIGPGTDPAGMDGAGSAIECLGRIAAADATFVSRGNDSGTHKKEVDLWQTAGLSPDPAWDREVGAGMGAALNSAVGLDAYILSDRASWLNFGNKGAHQIVFEGDPVLFNQYAFLPVSADRHPHVRVELVVALETWLTSPAAEGLINGYTIDGQQLFTFNAKR